MKWFWMVRLVVCCWRFCWGRWGEGSFALFFDQWHNQGELLRAAQAEFTNHNGLKVSNVPKAVFGAVMNGWVDVYLNRVR
ncbi:hypothetical protein J2X05_002308 [Cellvibrio fibrivorans]|uniref:Secreted protein n=1 Tax=Cellvibrio fibrivorans TaxID=126350 RepID=A0ABU1UYM3_9GAMM|nr:hypothetical protein [Cellvibrio fibrivorans]